LSSEIAPLWFTTVAVAPGAGVITGLTFASVTNAPPVPFKCVIRRPGIQPTVSTAEVIEVTTLAGSLVTAGTRNVESSGLITIDAGYEVYQYIGDFVRPIQYNRWVDDHQYARSWLGLYTAVTTASAGTIVHVSPGPAITYSTAPATGGYIPVPTGVQIDGHGVEITAALNGNPVYFSVAGTGPIGTARALSANVAKGDGLFSMSTANINLLIADGMAVGSYIQMSQTDTSAADTGSGIDQSMHRVWSIDAGGGAVYVTPPLPRVYLTAQTATARLMSVIKDCAVRNFKFDGAGINQGNIFLATYWVVDSVFENITGKDFYGQMVWNEASSFGLTFRHLHAYNGNIGSDVNGQIALNLINNCTVDDIRLGTGGWGIRCDAARHSTFNNIRVYQNLQRAVRIHHARMCSGSNILASGNYGTGTTDGHAGFTLSGDSEDNSFVNVIAHNCYEVGILLTHITASTLTIKNNYIQGRAFNNGLRDVYISGAATGNVLDIKAGTYTASAGILTNSFGDDFWVDVSYTAGDFTASSGNWTVDNADIVYFRYKMHRNTMTIQFRADGTDVSATPTNLNVKIPNGMKAVNGGMGAARISDAGTATSGFCSVVTAATNINVFRTDAGAYTLTAADNTNVQFTITFEVVAA
jgi:hypothetical protein